MRENSIASSDIGCDWTRVHRRVRVAQTKTLRAVVEMHQRQRLTS
jgi:hypothetical protein